MKYKEFRNTIHSELQRYPEGLTWKELKEHTALSYRQPCPEWVSRMEKESGLRRERRSGRSFVWIIRDDSHSG